MNNFERLGIVVVELALVKLRQKKLIALIDERLATKNLTALESLVYRQQALNTDELVYLKGKVKKLKSQKIRLLNTGKKEFIYSQTEVIKG